MTPYKNLSGRSGVELYEILPESIKIKFKKMNFVYTYDYSKPGRQAVDKMKEFAIAGKELSTYVTKEIKDSYASKTRF